MLPDISKDRLEGNDELSNNFFMYIFKVQPCPKRGAHDWSSCPYAHPKEKARRRDPRVYKYASTPCPESLKGVSCGRGVDCPYAHSVYEYWLHPSRFRTQMCKKGNQCNRTLCFFAHSASELRFPDTQDDLEAAAVDAAAASATAAPLPLCTVSSSLNSGQAYTIGSSSVSMVPNTACGSSLGMQNIMNLGQVDGSTGGFGLMAAAAMPQQQVLLQDELGSCYGGSDPALQIHGIAMQQPDTQSISDPLPRLGSEVNAMAAAAAANPAAWLQMAADAQLTGNQIMNQISRPQPSQQVQLQLQTQQPAALVPAVAPSMEAAYAAATGMAQRNTGVSNMFVVANPAAGVASADALAAGLANIGLADDSSGSSSCMTDMTNEQYLAALNACNAAGVGGNYILGMLQQTVSSPPRNENMLLLQQLQQHQQLQQQQQQLMKLTSNGSAVSRQSSGSVFMGVPTTQPNGSWVRMA